MKALIFSPASLFHLQQLSTLVKQKTNTRYGLSDPHDVLDLLRYCYLCDDENINAIYQQFLKELDDSQLGRYGLAATVMPAVYSAENQPTNELRAG
ncbi:MAG: hypothetical protein ACJAZJ_000716 [Candidatus Endobugula sp.]|jgi:hypothetical protein